MAVEDVTGLQIGGAGAYCQLDITVGPDGALYTATTDFILRIGP
jgi:hypothetical protein